jgi:hypothetical protein
MKQLIFSSIVLLAMIACNQGTKEEVKGSSDTDMKALYEKNLSVLKSATASFEKEDVNQFLSVFADSMKFHPPVYGAPDGGKEDLKNVCAGYFADWDSLKLVESNFLPGLDSTTHSIDGGVRYYGVWTGVHKSGYKARIKVYETYEFNKDNKIIDDDQYFDVSGMMNAVMNANSKK